MTVETSEPSIQEVIAELAKLPRLEYALRRKEVAKKFDIPVSTLDAEVEALRPEKESGKTAGRDVKFDNVSEYEGDVIGSDVLDEALGHLIRHMHMNCHEAVCCILWAAHTHMFKRFSHTPRIVISAPEPECGKTVLLHHLLGGLSNKPLLADNISPAVFFRVIEKYKPTFLIDEVDTWLKQDTDLIGSLHSGFEPHGQVLRCVGDDHDVRGFPTFTPVAIAGIEIDVKLPKTILSRSILVTLERVIDEVAEADSWDEKQHTPGVKLTGTKIAKWVHGVEDQIATINPKLPDGLKNRAYDKWKPLFAIAEIARGRWPDRITAAYYDSIKVAEPTKTELFLMDVKSVLPAAGNIHTADLIDKMCDLEDSRYVEYNPNFWEAKKKRIQPAQIANFFKKYKLKSTSVRCGDTSKKGYKIESIKTILRRYVPDEKPATPEQERHKSPGNFTRDPVPVDLEVTGSQSSCGARPSGFDEVTSNSSVTPVNGPKPSPHNDCDPVTSRNRKTRQPSQ